MPAGRYLHLDPVTGEAAAVEEFSCAPGPAGWRYVGTLHAPGGPGPAPRTGSVDLTVDARWRQVRVEVTGGGWRVRGGLTGPALAWVRSPAVPDPGEAARPGGDGVHPPAEGFAHAAGFTGRSPAFLVATARLLALQVGAVRRLRLVDLAGAALAPLTVEQGWSLTGVEHHETPGDPLPVERYEVADLAGGGRSVVHLAGDVVVGAPGLELDDLRGPPTLG